MKKFIFYSVFIIILILSRTISIAQQKISPFITFSLKADLKHISFLDLDNDGDPDILRTFINDTIPVQWIDDDDDMLWNNIQGDYDNDCLMIDRNIDGKYGYELDLMVDYVDNDGDGNPDIQLIADNARISDRGWTPGHFMIVLDTDNDGVFNFINWQKLELEPWAHEGRSNFYQDYSGNTILLKVHTSVFNMNDTRLSWENPFLFYDNDEDGFTEMVIRFADSPIINFNNKHSVQLTGNITDVRMSFDLDNDNGQGNEFDFDLSLKFSGPGFDYTKHKQEYKNLRGLPAADSFFYDPRWRQMTELIYVKHENAYPEILKGIWKSCWFVFDEDDDCERWERVEFYEPLNPFRIGSVNGGLDNNPQADASGDRGEWDMDNSGNGSLYIGGFDGKIHLYGAEWGAWRIDQNGRYFQGWQGWRNGSDSIPNDGFIDEPLIYSTIKYEDSNRNGFFDIILFDFNGDKYYEDTLSILKYTRNDSTKVYSLEKMKYSDFNELFYKSAELSWSRAERFLQLAIKEGVSLIPYKRFLKPRSLQEKYNFGFWLTQYLYQQLKEIAQNRNDCKVLEKLNRKYLGID